MTRRPPRRPTVPARWLALAALAGCTEYNLGKEVVEPDAASPDIAADGVSALTCTAPWTGVVPVRNEGGGPLHIDGIATTGAWTATQEVPLTLGSGDALEIPVEGEGEGTLTLSSDDPDEPAIVVDLYAAVNHPPEVALLAPTDALVLGEPAADQPLSGVVDDADGDDLLVTWWIDGVALPSDTVPPGPVSAVWPAPAPGDHTVTLAAADACATAEATVGVCQDATVTYENLGISTWHYEGSSYWDGSTSNLVLTDAAIEQVGTAFDTTAAVSGGAVTIDFEFYIGGGSGADGISLTALDTSRLLTYTGGSGCGIGYGGSASCTAGPALPGWSIEVDTYFNDGYDPTPDDHLAFTFDGDVDSPPVWAALPEMEDTGWHRMQVDVAAPHVRVSIDGTTYLDADLSGSFAFPAYVGFTAGTGGLTNQHRIRALTVTDHACE